ncbi:MAG: hypothetical protein CMH52_11820 [Myxococcales bacterium]|nr:hypothetical protein [Myxococcales bacterium]
MTKTLAIFAKSPQPGRVKTRLRLPPSQAAALHGAFVRDVVERHQSKTYDTVLYRADEPDHEFWSSLDVPLRDQVVGNLGQRMAQCVQELLNSQDSVVIIGTDSPNLPTERITQAFAALETHDAVLGPACDGGYYLIGMRRFCADLFPVDMPWGGSTVLTQTLAVLNESKIHYQLLDFWYDVDRPEDLALLCAHQSYLDGVKIRPASHTVQCIKALGLWP